MFKILPLVAFAQAIKVDWCGSRHQDPLCITGYEFTEAGWDSAYDQYINENGLAAPLTLLQAEAAFYWVTSYGFSITTDSGKLHVKNMIKALSAIEGSVYAMSKTEWNTIYEFLRGQTDDSELACDWWSYLLFGYETP